ncbi:helix-turn-helix domain-containing protein [Domibacillus mangrovi]|uniref:Helix-turn-helix domain-containing protein n=1 Tax=Domibacillus mangrovi TaxID=1714354 RepID=A0A1Q5P383_9BACI|nr:helix-turn-helix domain-containing protein [Domibacillus mangrovi]OKL36686.1 hypothetical protein BLL40_08080 [Domibacillus mangrovi]
MMKYQQFLQLMGDLGLPPYEYLPDIFEDIMDEFLYTLKDVADLSNKSVTSVRRWCTNGKLKFQQKRPYMIKGEDLKEKLFQEHYSTIAKRLNLLDHLDHPLLTHVQKTTKRRPH